MRTMTKTIALILGLAAAGSLFGEGFFPAVETATNFWGVGDILLMTETSSEAANSYLGDSWDVTVHLTAGVTSLTNAFAIVGPLSFTHHGAGLEPSTISVPAQPPIIFTAYTEPQWFEFSRTGPAPGDRLIGTPDFVYTVSGTIAYDGRTWFSWHPTVEVQVIPEANTSVLLAVVCVSWLLFQGRRPR